MEQRNSGKHPEPPRREDASHMEYMTEGSQLRDTVVVSRNRR